MTPHTSMGRTMRSLAALYVACALPACKLTEACTLMGCESGLTVHLASMPAAPFRVEVSAHGPGTQPVYVYDCASLTACRQDLFFAGFVAEQAVVTVRVGTATRTTTFSRLSYQHFRPNGPDCEPDCLQATVTADLPA